MEPENGTLEGGFPKVFHGGFQRSMLVFSGVCILPERLLGESSFHARLNALGKFWVPCREDCRTVTVENIHMVFNHV